MYVNVVKRPAEKRTFASDRFWPKPAIDDKADIQTVRPIAAKQTLATAYQKRSRPAVLQQLRLIVKMVRKASVFCSESLAITRIARINKKNNAAGRTSPADRRLR